MFIKLTKLNEQAIYINTVYIVFIEASHMGSLVTYNTASDYYEVKETPAQIMELINEHNEARI